MDKQKEQLTIDLATLRHSTSHIMADAVRKLFPAAKLAIGPSIEEGFYYDFEVPTPFSPDDLAKIAKEMSRIIKSNVKFERIDVSREEALKMMKDEPYKIELINELPAGEQISLYKHGNFIDLCRGPHIASTIQVKAYKLISATGAYWRGDEHNKMLQRIYGTAFPNEEDLKKYLDHLEEIKKRDHRKLGKELDLYSIQHEDAGPGLVYWHPKGATIRNIIEAYWKEQHRRHGYEFIYSPHIARVGLWKTSGHWNFYRENMYSPIDIEGQEYILKPMNCPGHILVYKSKGRSYRDLPLRWAELGTVYRYERSGVIQGLLRVRGFTQDDAHIFCRPEQIEDEILGCLDFTIALLKAFGFTEYEIELSVPDPKHPEKYAGSAESWAKAESSLVKALEARKLAYRRMEGEAVFYGPKIDLKIKDALGRSWQCTTIQFDFNLPERFDINYTADDGSKQRPYMVHRALLGSLERFFGVLIEHYGGDFPLWLAPIQAIVLPVLPPQQNYAAEVVKKMLKAGIRVESDMSNERLSQKIRNATNQKIPYMIIVGDKEEKENLVAVRERIKGDQGALNIDAFIDKITKEAVIPD
ncbi:MAG: threonine--tRNA ligase [Candidatus Brocadiia bacterium]